MAVKPSKAALTALRNTRRAKQEELGRAYEAMGGSNTALVSNSQFAPNTIPSLKRNIENRYAEAQNAAGNALDRNSQAYANLQSMTPAYNDYKIRETEEILNRLGQTDIARGSNSLSVERAKEGHLQSGLVNSLSENEKLGRLLGSLTGSSVPFQAYQATQNELMKGTLTDEMKALGLTQEDIDRWNRQQNELERREVETNYASQHPFMATLNSFPEMAAGSTEGVLDKLTNYLQGKPLESSPINAELYRNAVSQDMSGLGNFAYGVGTSMGDMGLASLFGGVGGPTVMGLEKANSVMNEAIDRGLTPNQIMGEGLASGASTAITEKLLGPFGKFAGNNALKAALGEGLQEGAEDIVDTLFDELITRAGGNNEKSVWNQNLQMYRDAGYSEKDAKKAVVIDYLKQLGIDFGAGAISGGVFQGGNNILNQRNVINGRSRVNTETENNAEANTEQLPVLRDSRAEEAAIQEQRNAEMAQLTEALAQQRETRDVLERNVEGNLEQLQQNQNYDPEEMEYLRNVLLDTSRESQNWGLPIDESRSAEEVITELKNRIINELQTNEPLAGEHVNDFINRLNYVAQNNPELQPFINEQLNEVMRESEGWVTDFGNQQIPQVRNTAEIQTAESNARQMVDSFIQDLEAGNISEPMNAYASVLADLTETAQNYPEIRENLNGMLREVNAAMPTNAQQTETRQNTQPAEQITRDNEGLPEDVANLTEENVGQALGDELEKLNASHPFKLDLFAEKGGEEELPVLKNEVHTGNYKTSKFATNTFPNSGAMTESEYSEVIPEDIKKYEAVTHEATLNAAEKNIKENGYTGEYNRLLKDNKWDAVDVDTAMMCAMREAENARNAEALGIDPNEAWGREVEIFKKARSQATAGGQMIEAFKKWSALTPEGKLGQAIAHVNETVKEKKSKNNPESQKTSQKIPTAAERYLTDEFMAEFLAKAHQYDGQDVSLLKQARLNAELAHMVNEQIPVRFRQKFTSLWMDNLLASFRTLISRNFGGNVGKAALDQTLVKAISGPIDNFISRYTGTRTTTGFTKEGVKTYLKGFAKGASQTARDYWTPNADPDTKLKLNDLAKEIDVFADANVTNRSGVNEESFNEALENNRVVFKNKALKLYDKIIKFGLAIGDNPFYKGTYDQTVLELNTLREQGKLKLPEDITEEEYQTWVKAVATAQGLEAVYQENSELAEGASDIKKGLSKMSEGYVGFDFLSGASMPFVRTPMNVIKTNLELSPLGIVKNTVNTVREIRSNLEAGRSAFDTESFDQRRFVRETSRNIVGLLMFATGLMLKNAGMLTGGYSDDKREAQAQKDAGMQEYAWVSPFSGNQYSIDWLPGIGSSFISASAFDDAFNAPDQDFLDALANGVKAGSASMFEQAALQGLRRLTGADTVSSSSDNIIDNVVKTVANTASSAIVPAFVRQSAAALDPYKRNTYGMGGKESVLNNAIAGIPFLRQTLEPRIGLNGQPIEQNAGRNGLEKWFDNLVNPAMVTVPSALENPVRDEAMRLYNETKNYTAFQPKISLSYLNVEGHQATTEEYTRFLQIADSAMNQTASDFIQSNFYNSLSDEEKEANLGSIYSTIQNVERAKFLGLDTEFDGEKKAYYEGGSEGLINYIMAKDALSSMGMDNNDINRQAVIQTLNSYGGDLPAMLDRYQSSVGRAGTDLDLLMNNQYSGLIETIGTWDSEAQRELRKEINSIISGVEFNSMVGIDKQYDGARKAYAEGGVNGLAEYLFPATVLKSMGMDNSEKNREMIMTAYNEGGANAVRQQVQAAQAFASSPYGENLTYRYSHATNYLPSLNPSQFAQLYDAVDQQDKGTSGFNTITQQEVIDYLNQNPGAYDSTTALQYWNALDQHAGTEDAWKKIPVLVNGEWQAKKA